MAIPFYPDPLIRIPFYIVFWIVTEVLFTGICDLIHPKILHSWIHKNLDGHIPNPIRRDPHAMAYTFLWMIPVAVLLIFIEPLSIWVDPWPLWARGFVYLGAFWVGEYVAGAIIKKICGVCPWDYSYSRFSLHGHIRFDMGPLWYLYTLLLDGWFMRNLVELTPAIRQVLTS